MLDNIINDMISIAINNTTEGNYIFYKDILEKIFNIKINKNLYQSIIERLEMREEIADIQVTDEEIDIILWLDYIKP